MASLKKTSTQIQTFEYDDDFMIDVVTNGDTLEAWLYHKDCGIKEMIFGFNENSIERFLEIVEGNLENESYIETYIEDYMTY